MKTNKSRVKLKNSLYEMLHERNIKDITVQELCEKAQCHRSTFYNNYDTIYDLEYDLFAELFDESNGIREKNYLETSLDENSIRKMINLSKSNERHHFLLMYGKDRYVYEQYMIRYFSEHDWKGISDKDRYRFIYDSIGIITVLHQWFVDGMPCEEEELINIFLTKLHSK